jgi:hypothetical protein
MWKLNVGVRAAEQAVSCLAATAVASLVLIALLVGWICGKSWLIS